MQSPRLLFVGLTRFPHFVSWCYWGLAICFKFSKKITSLIFFSLFLAFFWLLYYWWPFVLLLCHHLLPAGGAVGPATVTGIFPRGWGHPPPRRVDPAQQLFFFQPQDPHRSPPEEGIPKEVDRWREGGAGQPAAFFWLVVFFFAVGGWTLDPGRVVKKGPGPGSGCQQSMPTCGMSTYSIPSMTPSRKVWTPHTATLDPCHPCSDQEMCVFPLPVHLTKFVFSNWNTICAKDKTEDAIFLKTSGGIHSHSRSETFFLGCNSLPRSLKLKGRYSAGSFMVIHTALPCDKIYFTMETRNPLGVSQDQNPTFPFSRWTGCIFERRTWFRTNQHPQAGIEPAQPGFSSPTP